MKLHHLKMSKRFMIVEPTCSPAPKQAKNVSDTNWSLCIFCQQSTSEHLLCPWENNQEPKGIGYKTLDEDLRQFQALVGNIPEIDRLDDGSGLEATLKKHQAMWHRKC